MNTNENERILKIDKLKRLLVERSTPLTQTENYNFTCINSSQLLEHKLVIKNKRKNFNEILELGQSFNFFSETYRSFVFA